MNSDHESTAPDERNHGEEIDDLEIIDADELPIEMTEADESASSEDLEVVDAAEALEDDAPEDDFDMLQAQRTQVISTAEFGPVVDDDEGQRAADYSLSAPPAEIQPGRAHECLEIRTPQEEFETYVKARIETLTRLGESAQVELMLSALELGKQKLGGSIVRRN